MQQGKRKKKQKENKESAYYEVQKDHYFREQLPVYCMAGNVIYNGLHWHDNPEIMACLRGKFKIRVEEQHFSMESGDFIVISGGIKHEIYDGIENGLQIICSINPSAIRYGTHRFFQCSSIGEQGIAKGEEAYCRIWEALQHMAFLLTVPMNTYEFKKRVSMKSWDKAMEDIKTSQKERQFYDRQLQFLLTRDEDWYSYQMYGYQLLHWISRFQTEAPDNRMLSKQAEFQQCLNFIHENYGNIITINQVAEQINVSAATLYRMFSKQLGMSFVTYLNQVRLHAACTYLKHSNGKISDIAFSCGYTSLSNFYRVFTEQLGMRPSEYRKNKNGSIDYSAMQTHTVMKLNRFQNFYELPYNREILLLTDKV